MEPAAKSTLARKVGVVAPAVVVLRKIDRAPVAEFATTMSGRPSPLISATATETNVLPPPASVPRNTGGRKLALADPKGVALRKTATEEEALARIPTMRSGRPSAFRSRAAIETGETSAGRTATVSKTGVLLPGKVALRRMDTLKP